MPCELRGTAATASRTRVRACELAVLVGEDGGDRTRNYLPALLALDGIKTVKYRERDRMPVGSPDDPFPHRTLCAVCTIVLCY